VQFLDSDEDTDQVMKTIFYKLAAEPTVEPERLVCASSLFSLIWALLINRGPPQAFISPIIRSSIQVDDPIQRPSTPHPMVEASIDQNSPEEHLAKVRSFILQGCGKCTLRDLVRLDTSKAIVKEISMERCLPENCLPILQLLTGGLEGRHDPLWIQKLDCYGAELLLHFVDNGSIDTAKKIRLLTELLAATKMRVMRRLYLAKAILISLQQNLLESSACAQILEAFCSFVQKDLFRFSDQLPDSLPYCRSCIDLLAEKRWEFENHQSTSKRILTSLTILEHQFNDKSWTKKTSINAIRALVQKAHQLKIQATGINHNAISIERAVLEKNEILKTVRDFNKALETESRKEVRKQIESLSKVILSGLGYEMHLLQVDGHVLVCNKINLFTVRPKLPQVPS
jgi:hypothetical protein